MDPSNGRKYKRPPSSTPPSLYPPRPQTCDRGLLRCSRALVSKILGASALWFLTACGQPGAPQPPSLNLPIPVRDLSAIRIANTVHLEWTVSDRTTDHTAPSGSIRTRICRVEGAGACETVSEQPTVLGKGASWDDALPTDETQGPPRLLTYYVELQNHARKSAGRSNPGYAASGGPLPDILSPAASVLSQGVELQWQQAKWPPSSNSQRLIRIVRSLVSAAPVKAGRPATTQLSSKSPEASTQAFEVFLPPDSAANEPVHALDESARFDQTYTYQLQRVERLTIDGHAVQLLGPKSSIVSVTTHDIFPPEVPQQVDAVADYSSRAIDLSWAPDSEPDLAGYFVYRIEKTAGSGQVKSQRISGSTPLSAPSYHDATVRPGIRYAYRVSAVDQSGNESQPSNEAEEQLASEPKQ